MSRLFSLRKPLQSTKTKRGSQIREPHKLSKSQVELELPPESKLHYTRGALHAGDLTEVLGTDVNDRRWCKHVVVEQIVRLPADLNALCFRPWQSEVL